MPFCECLQKQCSVCCYAKAAIFAFESCQCVSHGASQCYPFFFCNAVVRNDFVILQFLSWTVLKLPFLVMPEIQSFIVPFVKKLNFFLPQGPFLLPFWLKLLLVSSFFFVKASWSCYLVDIGRINDKFHLWFSNFSFYQLSLLYMTSFMDRCLYWLMLPIALRLQCILYWQSLFVPALMWTFPQALFLGFLW